MKKKTTIYDIAEKLGITAATVSRALNNNSKISETTKKLVLKTAVEMNYEQNKLALALKSGKSYNVGVVVPRIDMNFFGSIIRAIEDELAPKGYHIIICQTHGDESKENESIDTLLNAQVDGILISSSNKEIEPFNRVLAKNIPLVFFDRKKTMKGVSSVVIDDFEGGYNATLHLIKQGYTRIAHLSGNRSIEIYKNRYLGYKQALIDNGLEFNEDYVIQTSSDRISGSNSLKSLLKLNPAPNAIFSASDLAALGAIQELKLKHIKVPNEFAVVGFSNEPFTKFMELSISTVDQSPLEMGKIAAQVFLEQVASTTDEKIEKNIVLPTELIIRKSSALVD
ncbi:LacI family DNA-binding transcriptional regulator [Algibacter mikhailovii]|uniref:HTH-type transcriptional regulator DegA n=1 Tax=Algibacter mikhailovii TaxID=425498 RepID=A0A918R7J5_9FLAO|nr:LacI family DNA-binding transcriptional regulator [Algibacter mikhailovii]GGZ87642.1 HTH-type transcriptional regulator DegA [Algibacter mikhailovii]